MPQNAAATAVAAAGAAGAAAAAGAEAGGQGQQGQQQRQQQGGLGSILGMIVRMGVMWYFMNMMKGKNAPPPPNKAGGPDGGFSGGEPSPYIYPAFEKGTPMDLYVFISERPYYHGTGRVRLVRHGLSRHTAQEEREGPNAPQQVAP